MEIRFSLTGAARKELVTAINEITRCAPVYKGAPTFAYVVSDYIIDRDGTVSGPDSQELLNGLADKGYTDPDTGLAYQMERSPDCDHDTAFPVSASPVAQEVDLVIEMPLDGFGPTEISNLEKMIASKAPLLRKALGIENLSVQQTETTLRFPWFSGALSGDEVKAYTQLIAALCQAAKTLKRVTAKEKTVDNEKYAFRCFLLRLGFIGEEYKPMRKILLRNLAGNSSFKSGARKPQALPNVGPVNEAGETVAEPPAAADEGNVAATGGDAAGGPEDGAGDAE